MEYILFLTSSEHEGTKGKCFNSPPTGTENHKKKILDEIKP